MKTVTAFVLLASAIPARGQTDEDAIRKVLTDQVEAWNHGEIRKYMEGYWNSDSTIFMSGGDVTKGYGEVLRRYEKTYATPEAMGRLEFSGLVVRKLSPDAAVVSGIWKLIRARDSPWGRFTLIVEKKPEGWRITHDHTSMAK